MGLFGFLTSWRKAHAEPESKPAEPAVARTARGGPPSAPEGSKGPAAGGAKAGKGKTKGASAPAPVATPRAPKAVQAEPGPAVVKAASPPVPPVPRDGTTDLAELDAIFGAGASQAVTTVSGSTQDVDKASVRELFKDIAGQQSAPIKNFVFELKRGTANKDWIEVCRPVMQTLVEAAESLGLNDEATPMRQFLEALALAADGDGRTIEPTVRELMLEGYEALARDLPEAFALGEDARHRESVVIHALLKQVPDVGRVTFDRLYGAGLTTLESLFQAKPPDLCSTTGIPYWLCERICTKLLEHRVELERSAVGESESAKSANRDRLRHLLAELKRENGQYEKAAEAEWADPSLAAAKRMARQNRQVCALKIEVVLAEMGELDLVERFQKSAFDQRIRELESFLGRSGAASDASPAAAGAVRSLETTRQER